MSKWKTVWQGPGSKLPEDAQRQRAFAVHVALLLMVLICGASAAGNLLFEQYELVLLNVLGSIAALGLGIYFWRTADVDRAAWGVVLLLMAVLAVLIYAVEHQHYALHLLSMVPPTALILLGRTRGLRTIIVFFAGMGFFVLRRMGSWGPVPFTGEAVFNIVTATAAVSLLILYVESRRDEVEQALAEKNKELEQLSVTDALTGLANRAKLDQSLSQLVQEQDTAHKPFAVLLGDLDHFKQINDTHGHAAGDAALKEVAELLQSQAHPDDVVGRWGGEEFLLLCPNTDESTALALAEAIRQAVPKCSTYGESLTISIGVAVYRPGDDVDSLLRRADRVLYRTKDSGRNQVAMA